jgi:hypothetical protein
MTDEAPAAGGPILTFAPGEYYFLVEFGFDVRLTKARLDD